MVEISSNLFLVSTLESTRFLRIQLRNAGLQSDCSLGSGKEERLEGGVGLSVEIFSVPKQPATLGGEQRARLLLREKLEREDDGDDEEEDEEAHLLVALEAGEGLVLALGGSRRPVGAADS